MNNYTISTDSFLATEFEAPTLNAAIESVFRGAFAGAEPVNNEQSLRRAFAPFIADGAWCWIEENGLRVVSIGLDTAIY